MSDAYSVDNGDNAPTRPPVVERFLKAARALSDTEAMTVLPVVKAWCTAMEGGDPNADAVLTAPGLQIGNKRYANKE